MHEQSYLECLREEELFQLSSLRPLGRSVTAVADIPLLSKLEHELYIGYPEANPSLGALAVLNHHVTLCAACASRGGARRICQGSIAGASLELLPVLQTALQPLQPCMQPKLVHRATFLLLCGGGEFGAQPNVCTLSTTQHLVRISLVDAPASRDSTPAEHTRSRREQAVYVCPQGVSRPCTLYSPVPLALQRLSLRIVERTNDDWILHIYWLW